MELQLESLRSALADRYAVEGEVGRGAMAVVFLAHDLRHDRRVAVKVLNPQLTASLGPKRFLREIRITAGLHHPHILPLYDSGEARGLLYYVMPFVEGESLRDRLRREHQLPVTDALHITLEVADALAFAHAHGIVHRDVKPGNILLEAGHAILADFGVARAVSAAGEETLTRSWTGIGVGTPTYASPEQSRGEPGLDGRSDLYSLGCVLYEMLAGRPPFRGGSPESVVRQHLTAEFPPITALRPKVLDSVSSALDRVLSKEPADRYSTAIEFMEALEAGRGSPESEATRPEVTFRVLGSVELRGRDGGEIASVLSQPKRLALLAYLAAATPRGFHRRDKLLGLFWPELDQERARAALRNALYVLRQALGEDILLGRGDEEVGLDFDRLWCDAAEYEEALNGGAAGQALDLYRGDLLEGFFLSDVPEFERWLEDRRQALRVKALNASQTLARQDEEAANLTGAIRWTRRAMDLEPLQERALQRLLTLLDRVGDRSGAIRAYERFAERLRAELEVEPAPETESLIEEIRSRERTRAGHDEEARGPTPPPAEALHRAAPGATPDSRITAGSRRRNRGRILASWTAAAVVLVAGAVTLSRLGPGRSPMDDQLVAVIPFENRTGDPGLDDIVGLAAEAATREIARGSGLRVVPTVTVDAALRRIREFQGDPARAVAAVAGAGIAVTGAVRVRRDSLIFEGQILEAKENRVLYVMRPAQSPADDPDVAVQALVDQITATLARHAEFGETLVGRQPPPSLAAYREYRMGLEAFDWAHQDDTDILAALEHFRRAADMDSTYAAPLLSQLRLYYDLGTAPAWASVDSVLARLQLMRAGLTPSEEAYLDLWAGLIRGDHDAAAVAARRGFAIDPRSFAFIAGYVEMRRNRHAAALVYFEQVDTMYAAFMPRPGFSQVPYFKAWALHLLGRHEEELAIALEARQRFPDDTRIRQIELGARVALGQFAEVERLVEEGLNAGDDELLFLLSREYRVHGHEDRAVEAAERLLDIYRNHCPPARGQAYCRPRSADQLAFLGRHPEALEIYRERWLSSFEGRIAEGLPVGIGLLSRVGVAAAWEGDAALVSTVDSLLAARHRHYDNGQGTLWRAIIAAHSGQLEQAMALFRQAVDEGVPWNPAWHVSDWYDPLRGYPPFEQFIRPKG